MYFKLLIFIFITISSHANELHPFTTDGCSRFPDGTISKPKKWRHCCVIHDAYYWAGGDKTDRKSADKKLKKCIEEIGHKAISKVVYSGVRVGGTSSISTVFRKLFGIRLGWGYGWEKHRGYRKHNQDERDQIDRLWPHL
jgi:hypothetical protein